MRKFKKCKRMRWSSHRDRMITSRDKQTSRKEMKDGIKRNSSWSSVSTVTEISRRIQTKKSSLDIEIEGI